MGRGHWAEIGVGRAHMYPLIAALQCLTVVFLTENYMYRYIAIMSFPLCNICLYILGQK